MKRAIPLLAAMLLAGCGGHAGSRAVGSASGGKGRATFAVRWPERAGRLVPAAANALVFTLSQRGQALRTLTLARPATQGTLTGLPYGAIDVEIEAKPNADGTGVAQAAGAGAMTVSEDAPGTLTVALDSTVAQLAITPAAPVLLTGKTQTLVASAQDAAGNVVLLAAGGGEETVEWTSSDPAIATVAGAGAAATLTGVGIGSVEVTARLKVRDDGTKLASAPFRVQVQSNTAFLLAQGGFPKDHGDRGNTGRAAGKGATGAAGWTTSLDAAAVGSLIVGPDGTVYAASGGTVAALGANGSVLWRHPVEGTVSGLLLTQGGALYVGAKGLTSLDAATGAVEWDYATPTPCDAPNVAADGTIYLPTRSGLLYALDPSDRTVRWTAPPFNRDSAVAVADDGTLVSRRRGALYKTTPDGVDTLFRGIGFGVPPEGISTPCIAGNEIVYQLDTYSAEKSERTGRTVYSYSRRAEAQTTAGAFTMSNTIFNYRGETPPATYTPLPGAAVSPDGTFVRTVAGAPTTLRGFKAGRQTFSLDLAPTEGASFSGDGVGYVATQDGRLVAFDPVGGTLLWSASLPSAASAVTPAVGSDGALYVGTVDGKVVQFR